jgi:hypothetical protein
MINTTRHDVAQCQKTLNYKVGENGAKIQKRQNAIEVQESEGERYLEPDVSSQTCSSLGGTLRNHAAPNPQVTVIGYGVGGNRCRRVRRNRISGLSGNLVNKTLSRTR